MSELSVVLGFVLSVLLTYIFFKWILNSEKKRYAKGPYGFPVIGHLPLFGKHPPTTFMKWWKSYGDVFSIRMGSWNTVVVNGYNAVKAAAEHPDDAFSGRPPFVSMDVINKRTGMDTLAFGKFSPDYLLQRKMAAKALRLFTSKRPEVIEELVSNEASAFAGRLIRKYKASPGYLEFDVQTLIVRIMYQFLYGGSKHVGIDRHVTALMDSLKTLNELSGSGSIIDVLPWLQYIIPWKIDTFKTLVAQADTITWQQVQEHYETFTKGNTRDVTDAIIASEADTEEIKETNCLMVTRLGVTLADLFGAASDTTHKTVVWLLLYMCAYPNVQGRVHAEIDEVVGKSRTVGLNDRLNLVYTDAVIYEVMRIVTQLPFSVPRYAIKEGRINGVHVDKGTVVIFNLYSIHHERGFWGDPDNFRPERFIRENNTLDTEKCNHVFPFGVGRRRCVGEVFAKMNVFLSFTTVMQKCKFVAPPGERLELSPIPGLVYSAKDFKVQVFTRV